VSAPSPRAVPATRVLLSLTWAVVVLGGAAAVLLRAAPERNVRTLLGVVLPLFFVLLVLTLGVRAAADRRQRPALLALTAAVALWGAGSAVFSAAGGVPVQQFPTPGEALFLLSYVGFAGFVLLDVPRRTERAAAVWLDVVVVCGGAVCLASAVLLTPVVLSMGGDGLALLLVLLYPLLDLVLAALVLGQVLLGERVRDLRSGLLVAGFVGLAAVDSSFLLQARDGGYATGALLDLAWGASFAVIGTAAARRGRRPDSEPAPQRGTTLVLASLVALAVLVLRPAGDLGWYLTLPALVTLVAAGFRLTLALTEARGAADAVLLSRTDELTGLANRRAVLADIADGLRRGGPLALVLLDLDGFKDINDSLGHAAGDVVLQVVARRLTASVEPGAVVARLGGDEFALVLARDEPLELLEIAHQVRDELLVPVQVDSLELAIRSSLGIAVRGAADVDATDLLRRADVAMYDAKDSRAGALLYDASRDGFSRQRLRLAEDLRRGIADGQLSVWYQPQVDASTRQLVAVEGLVRWQHPTLGLLQPGAFIPGARRSGLMQALSEVVMSTVVRDAAAWRREGFSFRVAMNSAPPELLGGTLLPLLYEALADAALPPGALVVEVTEDSFLSEPERARETLLELRSHHVEVSIDDYGTGFSSLAYLRDLPVQELKMDRSFVSTILNDPRSRVIVDSTTQMAHAMGLRLVAEGVEDELTARALAAMGVDLLQGYHVSRPMPADAVATWVRDRSVPRQAGPWSADVASLRRVHRWGS
jgi:diguanylate cyclase (GGDEF)-like protein